ncbi:TPR-like protein, partial [Tuber magnatum]
MVPYSRNRNFVGREDIIDRVQGLVEDTRHSRIALCGLGGSGKTEIALEYVYRKRGECHIFWVRGSEFLKFSEDYEYILECAGVRLPAPDDENDEQEVLFGVREWLESPDSGDWILVLDNADNEENFKVNKGAISKFVPQGPKGTVVFTTRSRQVVHREGCTLLEVGSMTDEESGDLLLRRIDNLGPLEEEDRRANDERKKDLLLRKFREIHREADMTESILSTHFITFDQLKEQKPAAANLLRLISFFDHQNIPEDLLLHSGLPGTDNPIDFRMAIGALMGFSLVTRSADKLLYDLHPLVQQSVQAYLSYDETCHWRATALEVIWRVFPDYDHSVRHICAAYLPHALFVTRDSTDANVGLICYRMAHYLLEAGYYNDAEVQIKRCTALRGNTPEDDPDYIAEINLLARVLQSLGKYQEAEDLNCRTLEVREKVLGPQHPDTLTTTDHLAIVLRNLGKYDEAEGMHRRALEGTERNLGPDHITTLARVDSLARTLQDLGKYDEAEKMHRRAVEGCEKELGSEHPETFSRIYSLALVLRRRGQWHEAAEMSQRVLEGREKALGPDHPDTLASVNSLALALRKLGKYDEVPECHSRALGGRLKFLGLLHPDYLASTNDLGVTLQSQKLYDEAAGQHRHALALREKVLGPEHPDTLTSLSDLALALQNLGKNDEAEKKHRAVLKSREKRTLGPKHHSTRDSITSLAKALQALEKYEEAEKLFRRVWRRTEEAFGADHPRTITSLHRLAVILRERGKLQEARKICRQVFEMRGKTLGPDHPSTLISGHNLALALQDIGKGGKKFAEAEKMFRRALEGYERVLGPEHPKTLLEIDELAATLQNLEKCDEVEELYRRVLGVREK